MTDKKISALTARTTLDGTEEIPCNVGGNNFKITTEDIVSDLSRIKLTGDTSYYVTTSGDDNNDGSLASPWATLQHAMNYIAGSVDTAAVTITINIGAGTFAGFGNKDVVGSGNIWWKGAGAASTTIIDGPSDGVVNFGEAFDLNFITNATHFFTGMTFAPTTLAYYTFAIYVPAVVVYVGITPTFANVGDVEFSGTVAAPTFGIFGASDIVAYNPVLNRSGISTNSEFDMRDCAEANLTNGITINGNPTYSQGIWAASASCTIVSPSITGAFTGPEFALLDSSLEAATAGDPGTLDGGVFYSSNISRAGSHLYEFRETSDPSAPAADRGVLYCRDTGGKTQLAIRFNTGAVQVIATEP